MLTAGPRRATPAPTQRCSAPERRRPGGALVRTLVACLSVFSWAGCQSPAEVELRREVAELRGRVKQQEDLLAARQATIDELHRQLAVARGISDEDIGRLFYPERLIIDRLTGGYDSDGAPGDDGVVVYLKPVDREGDVLKVPGDITIQLYDLAAPAAENLVGEYRLSVDEVAKLWHGKLWTNHFTIRCPWLHRPPRNPEITVRAIFVDYLTRRVVSAQSTCTVKLPPQLPQ